MRIVAPIVREASALTGENRERLMALAYRESLCSFALVPPGDPVGWGDNGNGFGIFQIDKRYHPDFIQHELGRHSWAHQQGIPYYPLQQALYACGLLREAREWFKRSASAVTGDALERAVYASYNAGVAAVARALRRSPTPATANSSAVDEPTTQKNYSAYIFALASAISDPKYGWLWARN